MKLSDKIFFCLFIINTIQAILFIGLFIGTIPLAIADPKLAHSMMRFIVSDTFNTINGILAFFSIAHWIFCLRFWYKYDKYSLAIIPLIFLNSIYAPFYFYRVKIKKRPLKGEKEEKEIIAKTDISISDTEFKEITRNNIINIIDLWASEGKQLEYQKNVPIAQVSDELFCQWDDFYNPESDDFKKAFNDEELKALGEFNKTINKIANNTKKKLPQIDEFLKTEGWLIVNQAAKVLIEKYFN